MHGGTTRKDEEAANEPFATDSHGESDEQIPSDAGSTEEGDSRINQQPMTDDDIIEWTADNDCFEALLQLWSRFTIDGNASKHCVGNDIEAIR